MGTDATGSGFLLCVVTRCRRLLTADLVKQLHGVGGDGQEVADVGVASKHTVNVVGERAALVLVDRVLRVGAGRALDGNTALDGLEAV